MKIEEWLNTKLGQDIWNNKYKFENESFDDWLNRISGTNKNIKKLILEKKFLFGGRILANRGLQNKGRKISYSNCFVVSPPEDNIESIFDCAKNMARTYSYGGGVGVDISKLSPRGARVNNAAKETTGSCSFMNLYSLVTELIGMHGRRGALMISIDCKHPDLLEFINIKNDLTKVTKANISIRLTDDFMKAVKENKNWELEFIREETGEVIKKVVNANELFHKIAENNWNMAEPGALFWDNICNYNLLSEDKNFSYSGVNPCIPLGEYVLTENGFTKIENVSNKIILNGNEHHTSNLIYTGKKMVYEVELENGITIKMTNNHKITTQYGDAELKDLKIGDKVKVDYTSIFDMNIDNTNDYEKGIIAGWFISDGCFMKHHSNEDYMISFSVGINEFEYLKTLENIIQKHFDENFIFTPHSQKTNSCYQGKIYKQNLVSKFKNILNIDGWNKYNIHLEDKSKSFKIGFIKGLFTCDGSSHSSSFAMYSSKNKDFLKSIQRILMEFGIYSNLTLHNKAKAYVAIDNKIRNNSDSWVLEIYDKGFINIGYLTSFKQNKLLEKAKDTPKRIQNKKIFNKIKNITQLEIMDVYDINVNDVHHFNLNGIVVHNCAEEPLPSGGSCLLGSINLSELVIDPFTKNAKFNFNELKKIVPIIVEAMNEVLDEGLLLLPLKEQYESAKNWRQIGIGIMGLADMLIQLGIKYGNEESLKLCDEIGFTIANTAIQESATLAYDEDIYPNYSRSVLDSDFLHTNTHPDTYKFVENHGLRNSQLLTIAPTGSLSSMLGVSGGIEPIYNISYTRKTESLHGKDEYYKIYTPIVEKYMTKNNIENENELPNFFVTAMTLNYKDRIKMQAVWQKHIDASISSTVNVPENFTIEQVKDLYMFAWENKLKGVTIYRDNCARTGILTNTTKDNTEEEIINECIIPKKAMIRAKGERVKLPTGCGSIWLMTFKDKNNNIEEIFSQPGTAGGCQGLTEALTRTVSLLFRSGVDSRYIIDQLQSVKCPVAMNAMKQGKCKGKSCSDIIAKELLHQMGKSKNNLIKNNSDNKKEENNSNNENTDKCPECGMPINHEGGCVVCNHCGYSKCG